MATKNLKKLMRRIYNQDGTLSPKEYPTNFNRAIKYLNAKDKSVTFNTIFKPLYKQMMAEELKVYADGGHKISGALKKEMKEYVKDKAKKTTQTEIAAKIAAKQDYEESQTVLPEG